jgi:hypothetical protein
MTAAPFISMEGVRKGQHRRLVQATPYQWVDPMDIPPRDFLYGAHHPRGYVVVDVATGGAGKTALAIAESVAMATAKPILGQYITRPLRVWFWCLEDPHMELVRRIQAVCEHYDITQADLGDRLFIDSRDQSLCTAQRVRDGVVIQKPVIEDIIAELIEREIDLLIVDPFVSSHDVPENDNGAIDKVVKEWGLVAATANCCVKLIHHIRKTGDGEVSTESARGGKAITDAARSVRVLRPMTEAEGIKARVDNHRQYVRVIIDKANMTAASNKATWFRIIGVGLANGDHVGVVTTWEWPDAFAGITPEDTLRVQQAVDGQNYRADVRAANWVGYTVADTLGIDINDKHGKALVQELLATWFRTGVLVRKAVKDRKTGRESPCVIVGKWAND